MTPTIRLSENVVNRILAECFRTLNESPAKADFLEFSRCNAVLSDMFNPILRPDELVDRHPLILGEQHTTRNVSAITASVFSLYQKRIIESVRAPRPFIRNFQPFIHSQTTRSGDVSYFAYRRHI